MSNNSKLRELVQFIESMGVIHCDTLEKSDFLKKELDELGYRWSDGERYIVANKNNFLWARENTGYRPATGTYGSISGFILNHSSTILPLEYFFPYYNNKIYISNNNIKKIIKNYE